MKSLDGPNKCCTAIRVCPVLPRLQRESILVRELQLISRNILDKLVKILSI